MSSQDITALKTSSSECVTAVLTLTIAKPVCMKNTMNALPSTKLSLSSWKGPGRVEEVLYSALMSSVDILILH
jgi:hypothetical protein